MGIVLVVIAALVVVGIVALAVRSRSRSAVTEPVAKPLPESVPMLDLESALDTVTDRSGRNIRQRMEAVLPLDDLQVTDETGPVLRRALDHVAAASAAQPRRASAASTDTTA